MHCKKTLAKRMAWVWIVPGSSSQLRSTGPSGLLAVASALLLTLTAGCAVPSPQGFVRGVVVRVDPARVEVQHKTGQRVIVATAPTTTVIRDGTAAPTLRVRQRIDVDFDRSAAPPVARRIRIWSGPAR